MSEARTITFEQGCNTKQLCEIIDFIHEKHLRLQIVGSITLDCRNGKCDPMSEAFLQMAGVFSQLELARVCDMSRTTVYKYVSLLEK